MRMHMYIYTYIYIHMYRQYIRKCVPLYKCMEYTYVCSIYIYIYISTCAYLYIYTRRNASSTSPKGYYISGSQAARKPWTELCSPAAARAARPSAAGLREAAPGSKAWVSKAHRKPQRTDRYIHACMHARTDKDVFIYHSIDLYIYLSINLMYIDTRM